MHSSSKMASSITFANSPSPESSTAMSCSGLTTVTPSVGGLSAALKQGDSIGNFQQHLQPGSEALRQLFVLPPGAAYFNASYGNVPVPVMQAQWALQLECESDPQAWMLGNVAMKVRRVRSRLARYVRCSVEDLVLVENCTTAANAVLRSLPIPHGSVLIHLSTAYGIIKNGMAYAAAAAGARVVEVPVEFHGHETEPRGAGGVPLAVAVAAVIEEAHGRGEEVALACFDHIASCPGALMPVFELARACSARGVPVMLDGAHVLGQLPVDVCALEAAGVHYWISDAHKWLFSPKGSAVLWVTRSKQSQVQPAALGAAVASGASTANFNPAALAGLSEFERRFQYTGTRDYTPLAAIDAALDFRATLGESAIVGHNNGMAQWAQSYLASLWETEALLPASSTCAMAHVRLSPAVSSKAAADALATALKSRYAIYVMLFALPSSPTTFWVRPCMQVYVTHKDVERLGEAVLDLLPLLPAVPAIAHWRAKATATRASPHDAVALNNNAEVARPVAAPIRRLMPTVRASPDSVLLSSTHASSSPHGFCG